MTHALCKGCGESLGAIDDYSAGDTTACPACGSDYDFVENDDPRFPNHDLWMRNVPDESARPGVASWVEVDVEDGTVLYEREDGVRVRDYADEHDIPDDVPRVRYGPADDGTTVRMTVSSGDSGAADAEVSDDE